MAGAVDRNILKLIGQVILEEAMRLGVEIVKIILFGSRARGDHREDSDWDLLVVVGEKPHWRVKNRLFGRIHRRLVRELRAPVDLLIVSARWFYENASDKVTLEVEALETGIEIPVYMEMNTFWALKKG